MQPVGSVNGIDIDRTANVVDRTADAAIVATGGTKRGTTLLVVAVLVMLAGHAGHWYQASRIEGKIDALRQDMRDSVARMEAVQAATDRQALEMWKALARGEIRNPALVLPGTGAPADGD